MLHNTVHKKQQTTQNTPPKRTFTTSVDDYFAHSTRMHITCNKPHRKSQCCTGHVDYTLRTLDIAKSYQNEVGTGHEKQRTRHTHDKPPQSCLPRLLLPPQCVLDGAQLSLHRLVVQLCGRLLEGRQSLLCDVSTPHNVLLKVGDSTNSVLHA